MKPIYLVTLMCLSLCVSSEVWSQSYTTEFPDSPDNYVVLESVFWVTDVGWPAVDERHPAVSADFNQRVQTSDWWTSLIYKGGDINSPDENLQSTRMYSHPLSQMTESTGLGLDYNSAPDEFDADLRSVRKTHYNEIVVGMENLNSTNPTTKSYSDWMVTAELSDGAHTIEATYGHGNPMAYFTKSGQGDARIEMVVGWNLVSQEDEVIVVYTLGHKWAFFAPAGSTWELNGNVYTSDLGGKNYWSVCLLPSASGETTASYPAAVLEEFRKHAYAFPTNSEASYAYNQATQTVSTNFAVSTTLKETGNANVNSVMQALYPHQWANSSSSLTAYTYESPRGEMKLVAGNTFATSHSYAGVLATLPHVGQLSEGYSATQLNSYLGDMLTATVPVSETYNQGKHFTQFIQLAQIANLAGEVTTRDYFVSQIQTVLENWLTASPGETTRIMWYNEEWDVLVGYPDGHYMASLLNDKHFHWGYFIDAACLIEQFNPSWADTWGDMVNLMIRDAASWDRDDSMFPYLRNFDPYAGHSWAGGNGAGGNNQESSSEGMNFHQAVIKWGELTDNTTIRDLGVYLYATETAAIEEYWYNENDRSMPEEFATNYASRVFSNGIDSRTFWTYDDWDDPWIINMLPITGGSLYLGKNPDRVNAQMDDYFAFDGLTAPTTWNDILWSYLALADPAKALAQFEADPDYSVEFAESRAHTYHWLHNMNVLGQVNNDVKATNSSTAIVFKNGNENIYVAFNPKSTSQTVSFSDGFSMEVGSKETVTNLEVEIPEPKFNLALYRSITSSSDESVGTPANFANDGNRATRWSSEFSDPQWLVIDLEETYHLSEVVISWEAAASLAYQIEVSDDNENWESIYETVEGDGGTDYLTLSGVGRYMRVYSTERLTNYGVSIYEVEVYGSSNDNTAPVANAGSNQSIVLPTNSVNLSGSATDEDGDEISWQWSQLSGPSAANWTSTMVSNPTVSGLEAGVYVFQLVASDGQMTDQSSVQVTVDPAVVSDRLEVPGRVEAEDFRSGGQQVGYYDTSSGNTGGAYNTTEDVDIQITGDSEGLYNVGWIAAGEWLAYDITALTSNFDVTLRVASPNSSGSLRLEIDGVNVTGTIAIPSTGSWHNYTDLTIEDVSIAAGDHELKIVFISTRLNLNYVDFVGVDNGSACTQLATNGDYSVDISVDSENPTVTFVPTAAGTGDETLLFYYSTNENGPFGGHWVSDGASYQVSASSGETVYFYYTYNVPEGGERNSAANKHSFVVGDCGSSSARVKQVKAVESPMGVEIFPNPAKHTLYVNTGIEFDYFQIIDMSGKIKLTSTIVVSNQSIDLSRLRGGYYLLRLVGENGVEVRKFFKQD